MKHSLVLTATLLASLTALHAATPMKDKPPVPDFTKDGTRDESQHDWTLGPTGARGWVWAWKQQTTDARQILVTEVATGSPADGVLQKDDVILGVNGRLFGDDARVKPGQATKFHDAAFRILEAAGWKPGSTAAALQARGILREQVTVLAPMVEVV